MAEQTKKEVIIDVKVQRDERIKELLNQMGSLTKEIVECDLAISKIKKEARSNGAITQEQAKGLAKLTAERKAANKQLQSLAREEQNLVVANAAAKNSLNALRAEYNALKVQIANLDVDGSEFAEMSQQMDVLVKKISKAEQSYGVFSRNVGNYKSGFSALSFQIQQVARELPSLTVSLPQFFLALSNNIPMLADELSRSKAEIKEMKAQGKEFIPLGTQIFKSIFSWQTGLVVIITLLTAFGKEIGAAIKNIGKGKDAMEAFRKSASAMAGSIAGERAELAGLFNALSKAEEGTANYLAVRNVILDKYGDLLENEREEVRNLNDIATAYDTIAKKISAKAIMEGFSKQIEEQSSKFGETYNKYFAELLPSFNEKFGNEAIPKLLEFLGLLQEGTTQSVSKAKEFAKVFTNEVGNNVLLTNFGVGTIFGKDTNLLSKISKDFAESTKEINGTVQAMQELGEVYGFDTNPKKGGGSSNEEFQKAQRSLELEQKIAQEKLALQRATEYNSKKIYEASEEEQFKFEITWAKKEFELEQTHQKDMLNLQLQYGEITREEYDKEFSLLAIQASKFNQEQLTEQADYFVKAREQALKDAEALRKDVLKYNEETEKQANKQKWEAYRQSVEELATKGVISATEKGDLLSASRASEEAEDNAITTKYIRARRSEEQTKGRNIQEIIEEQYSSDLRQFSNSERERLQLAIETQKAIIEERKKAGLETYEQEAALAHLEKDLKTAILDDELALAWNSANEQYRLRKEFLEKELELYADNAAEQARIQREIAENESQRIRAQLDEFNTYASAVGELLTATSEIANSLYERQLETERANNEAAQDSLQKRYNAGLISAKAYNNEKVRLDEDLAKKEALIARKQAIMNRAAAIFSIGVDTASGIMNIWATHGANPIMAGILTGLLSATSALQLGKVFAEPLPKARKGGRIKGATHEAGGVLIETEDEERIIGANPAKAYPELLNLISYLGKRGAAIPDTGYALRHATGGSNNVELARQIGQQVNIALQNQTATQSQMIGEAVGIEVGRQLENLKIYTDLTEVRKADKLHTRIVNSAKM